MQTTPELNSKTLSKLPEGTETPSYLGRKLSIGVVHFGVGNFHRSHQAMYMHRLLQLGGNETWAICGVGLQGRDERIRDVLVDQDGLYSLTTHAPDGRNETAIIGSIQRFLHASGGVDPILTQMVDPGVRIVSLTVTEGGYFAGGEPPERLHGVPEVRAEVLSHLSEPRTAFGFIVAALRERRRLGIAPFAVVSCDNIRGNGEVARESVLAIARLVDTELAAWIDSAVSFPNTMVDRITPATTEADVVRVERSLGVHDSWPVAAESFAQWVLEDKFPNGRPPLELVGAVFTDDVDGYELAKLRLLNGLHQAIAYIGHLAGYRFVHEAIADQRIRAFLNAYLAADAVPSFAPPPALDVDAYCSDVLARFANTMVQDPLARLSVDSSDRVPLFVLPVALDRHTAGEEARYVAAVVATWCEYWNPRNSESRSSDRAGAHLEEAAERSLHCPADFLRATPVLAELAREETFVTEFVAALSTLRSGGPDAFLTEYGTSNDAD